MIDTGAVNIWEDAKLFQRPLKPWREHRGKLEALIGDSHDATCHSTMSQRNGWRVSMLGVLLFPPGWISEELLVDGETLGWRFEIGKHGPHLERAEVSLARNET
jgi:hypothetical protein